MQWKIERREEFEYWLAHMDDFLEAFLAERPVDIRRRLDFGGPSLDVAEALILETFPDTKSMLEPGRKPELNALACYIGETFRRNLGGKWDIRLHDPKFAFFGLPILVGGRNQGVDRCPLTLATATADRRTGKYLRSVFENASRP